MTSSSKGNTSSALQLTLQTPVEDYGKTGPILWMCDVQEIQSNSYQVFMIIKRDVEHFTLIQFNGDDISKYILKMRLMLDQLSTADRLPEDILITIIIAFTSSTVEEFRMTFHGRKNRDRGILARKAGRNPKRHTTTQELHILQPPARRRS